MQESKKQEWTLLRWLAKLLPKQAMQGVGDGNVQVEKAQSVHITNAEQITHVNYFINSPTQIAPTLVLETPTEAPDHACKPSPTAAQREVLQLLRKSRREQSIARWMQRTFGTSRVLDLDDQQCFRVRRYCESIIGNNHTKTRIELGR